MGILIFLFVIVLAFYGYKGYTSNPEIGNSQFCKFFPGLTFSAQDFYSRVEEACKRAEIPDAKYSKKTYAQSGLFSARREYFRVARNEFVYDICAAPYGKGFFVSCWLGETNPGILERIPVLNSIFGKNRERKSYYQADTEAMFRMSVISAVNSVIDEITEGKGIRGMTELERQAK